MLFCHINICIFCQKCLHWVLREVITRVALKTCNIICVAGNNCLHLPVLPMTSSMRAWSNPGQSTESETLAFSSIWGFLQYVANWWIWFDKKRAGHKKMHTLCSRPLPSFCLESFMLTVLAKSSWEACLVWQVLFGGRATVWSHSERRRLMQSQCNFKYSSAFSVPSTMTTCNP